MHAPSLCWKACSQRFIIEHLIPLTLHGISAVLTLALLLLPAAPLPDNFVDKEVVPLLKQHCGKCHLDGKNKGGLSLDGRLALEKGGDTGPVVDTKNPRNGLLAKSIGYGGELKMPPSGKLPKEHLDKLLQWIDAGAPLPVGSAPPSTAHKSGPLEDKSYWAYQTVKPVSLPKVGNPSWARNPVDSFILAKLEKASLTPNPEADRRTLLRRLSYDLTGLAPTPEEIDAFVSDKAPDAWEKQVDRLLASPHYGERWGRHWLDVIRYAETNGYERDGPKPNAWRFRDYVIRSFNADKPFDRLIREMIAGDEIDPDNPDAITGTAYYRLGIWDDEPADPLQARFDEFDDIVATTTQALLGMTMNCARCHDHKIDPIPQADYYRMLAFFRDIPRYSNDRNVMSATSQRDITPLEKRRVYEDELRQRQDQIAALKVERTGLENTIIKRMSAEDQRASEGLDRPLVLKKLKDFQKGDEGQRLRGLADRIRDLERKPVPSQVFTLAVNHCAARPEPTHVMARGNPHAPGAVVEPGFPKALGGSTPAIPQADPKASSAGRRKVLADWLASPSNPLTARVWVNRIWQHHFGRGIVASSSDFGKYGTPPTHPELLDWLAAELVRQGWKAKPIHRLLLTSAAYRMSSAGRPDALAKDPANNLFWRQPMRRLSAEEVRDSFLQVAGQLSLEMGGESVYPPIPREVLAGQSVPGSGWPVSPPEKSNRRSVYVHVKRSLQLPILGQFDQADPDSPCPVRYTTTVPAQALGLLNGSFSHEQAGHMARRLEKEAPGDLRAQVARAIRLTTGRIPSPSEINADTAYAESVAASGASKGEALRQYCLLALNASEFLYLD